MKKNELHTRYINVIQDVCKRVPQVNCGGCGVYALELSKVLKEHNIKHSFYMLFHELNNRTETKNLIDNNKLHDFNNKTRWTHIVVKIGGYFFDGTDIRNCLEKVAMPISEEFLNGFVKLDWIWNPMFDRTSDTKKIRRIFKKHLQD